MRFADWPMVWLLLALPALWALELYMARRSRAIRDSFASPEMLQRLRPNASAAKKRVRAAMLWIALLLLVLTLAQFQFGRVVEEVSRRGVDIVVAMDCSASMRARDIEPSRLDKARSELSHLIQRLQGDRVAIIAFAGTAHALCPLTLDRSAALMYLEVLDTDLVPYPGTNVAAAIDKALEIFDPADKQHRVLVLISDGESLEGDLDQAIERARQANVRIYTLGVGGARGEPIPEFDDQGRPQGFKKDRSGQLVQSRLDEAGLTRMAEATGGLYRRATYGEHEIDTLYNDIQKMEQRELDSTVRVAYKDRFPWFLVPALALLILQFVLSERRDRLL
ncbi:MAG: VWA domain-containing protein [Candidatus Alcyoniella australis]|nr:VWA domain-containing protein [Candidatus Alcyoniella australis]